MPSHGCASNRLAPEFNEKSEEIKNETTYCISTYFGMSSPAGIGSLQLELQFMALLQLLNLFFASGSQFLELIDSIPHFG